MHPVDQPPWAYDVCRKSWWGLSLLFEEPLAPTKWADTCPTISGSHLQSKWADTCPAISGSHLQTIRSILFWSDYSYIPIHRPSHMAGRVTARQVVGKEPRCRAAAGNLLSATALSTTVHIVPHPDCRTRPHFWTNIKLNPSNSVLTTLN